MDKDIKLNDAFEFIRNGASIKQSDGAGGYPITRIETIANGYVDSSRMGYADIQELEKYEDYILKKGDILMSHINSEKHLGKSALYVDDTNEVIHGMNLLGLRCKKEILLPKYAFYYFSSELFKRQIPRITKKSVNQASFSVTDLKQLTIFTLSINEQQKIATILDKAQSLIDKRKEQIEACDELVKSLFYDMFGDPIVNSKKWPIQLLTELGVFKNGVNYGQKDNGYITKCIGVGDFKNGIYIKKTNQLADINLLNRPNEEYFLRKNDIIFVRSNGSKELVGRSVIVCDIDIETTFSGFCIRYRNNSDSILPVYLINLFANNSFKKYIKQDSRGCSINNLNQQMLSNLEIPVPPLHIQNKFAAQVEKIEQQKQLLGQSLIELENNFNSLMQRAFKGELF